MDGLLRRVLDIDARCIKHGVSFRPQLVGRDVVLTYSDIVTGKEKEEMIKWE